MKKKIIIYIIEKKTKKILRKIAIIMWNMKHLVQSAKKE